MIIAKQGIFVSFLFQALYDKDIFADDFLGNVLLTLDQLKELSLKVMTPLLYCKEQ